MAANSMSQEILSVAIYEALPGKEEASLATMRDLFAALAAGGYSRDRLYRDEQVSLHSGALLEVGGGSARGA